MSCSRIVLSILGAVRSHLVGEMKDNAKVFVVGPNAAVEMQTTEERFAEKMPKKTGEDESANNFRLKMWPNRERCPP